MTKQASPKYAPEVRERAVRMVSVSLLRISGHLC